MLHCNITQHSTAQHEHRTSAIRRHAGMLASTGPACVRVCPAAVVIPTMGCCYRPSHGMPWCGMALSQSVSRDLSPSLPLGRWVGGCTNWDADADLGCTAGPASLQPSWAQTSDGDLSRTLPHLPSLSARFAARFVVPEHKGGPLLPCQPNMGRKGCVGGRGQEGGEKGTKGALGSFGSKATPGPAPCSDAQLLPGQPGWMTWVDGGGR